MVNRINDIVWQARQGSVAAIIQVLNEQLASSGVRTRAIFDDGVLQLLCEAHSEDRLEQVFLVQQVQQILESISPRNIHRVNINSRIVREQQLLWLEEINRNPESQVLWSQEIVLVKPSFFKRFIQASQESRIEAVQTKFPKSQLPHHSRANTHTKSKVKFWQKILGVSSLCLFLVLLGGFISILLRNKLQNLIQTEASKLLNSANNSQQQVDTNSLPVQPKALTPSDDPFAAAVRIANQAHEAGKTATTSAQWLDLAARWQRASELMSMVPPSHRRYAEARIRTKLYKRYSKVAEQEAQKKPL